MKFGVIDENKLTKINFDLPKDSIITKNTLNKNTTSNIQKNLLIGSSVWRDSGYINKLYPKGTPPSKFLALYSNFFDTIELNSSFYGIPSINQIKTWKNSVNKNFKFCPKIPKNISHRKNINIKNNMLNDFLFSVSNFEENLGPIFLQLPPYFDYKNILYLKEFINSFPKEFDLAIELRNHSWFVEPNFSNIYSFFQEKNIISIITDTPGRRDVLHQSITSNKTFIRFVGNNLHETDYTRIKDWLKRIKLWLSKGLKKVYFMIHQPSKGNSYDTASYIKKFIK